MESTGKDRERGLDIGTNEEINKTKTNRGQKRIKQRAENEWNVGIIGD